MFSILALLVTAWAQAAPLSCPSKANWALCAIGAPGAWLEAAVASAAPVTVAVLDTGVEKNKNLAPQNFAGRVLGYADFANRGPRKCDSMVLQTLGDRSHGTAMAAIVAANHVAPSGATADDVLGLAPASGLLVLRLTFDELKFTDAGLADALCYVRKWNQQHPQEAVRVLLMALSRKKALGAEALAELRSLANTGSVLLVVASSNGNAALASDPRYPAAVSDPAVRRTMLVTGAFDRNRSWHDSRHDPTLVDLAAPGVEVRSLNVNGQRAFQAGSSPAAALVAGAAALGFSRFPAESAEQMRCRIIAATRPAPGHQGKSCSGGVLDLARLFDARPAPDGRCGCPSSLWP